MLEWLEASRYRSMLPDKQKAMRKQALMPINPGAEMPGAYRLWRTCKEWDTLWWDGGLATQPHLLMLEFSACAAAHHDSQDDVASIERILNG